MTIINRTSVVLTLACLGPVFAQTQAQPRYTPPAPYSAAPAAAATPSATAAAAAVANGREQAMNLPQPRPGAMPSPVPARSRVQEALDQVAPLNPDEIVELRKKILERQRAASENVTGRNPARPVTSSETLDLSPGASPPVIRVARGEGAVISFVDAAGRPWEIQDDLNFNARAFAVKLLGPHLYSVSLKAPEPSHLVVVLKGLARPISVTAVPAVEEADYIKEFVVPRFVDGLAPATVASAANEGALAFNAPELLNYLYRTPPASARALKVQGLPDVLAWQISPSRMVVRTSGQVVIPAFFRRHGSSDGAAVFEVPLSPVVSVTQGGALHRVQIVGIAVEAANQAQPAQSNR
jgi:intracellular multiplication protein IcmK